MSSSDPSSQCVGFPWVPTCIASCPLKHTSMLLDTDGYTYDSITDFDRISYKQSAHECRAECAAGVEAALADAARLGFGDPVAISAETGKHRCTCCCVHLTCQLCQQQVIAGLLVCGWYTLYNFGQQGNASACMLPACCGVSLLAAALKCCTRLIFRASAKIGSCTDI